MPSYVTKRGKRRVIAGVMVNGITRRKWWPDDSKDAFRAAAEWEAQQKQELKSAEEILPPKDAGPTILEWQTAYLAYVKPRVVKKTFQEKVGTGKRLVKFFRETSLVKDIGPRDVALYLEKQAASRSGNAANKDRKNLAVSWDWGRRFMEAFSTGEANPWLQVDKHPEIRLPRYVPPENDFWAVLDVVDGQDRVMLITALHLALRRGEMFGLTWADVDFGGSNVRVFTAKRKGGHREYDWLPMTRELRKELLWWWENRPIKQTTHVFTQIYDSSCRWHSPGSPFKTRQHFMKAVCDQAGVKHFGFHSIRHLSASILYRAGYPVAVIQRILRHKAATTTERYLKRLGLEELRIDDQVFARKGPAKIIPLPDRKMHTE